MGVGTVCDHQGRCGQGGFSSAGSLTRMRGSGRGRKVCSGSFTVGLPPFPITVRGSLPLCWPPLLCFSGEIKASLGVLRCTQPSLISGPSPAGVGMCVIGGRRAWAAPGEQDTISQTVRLDPDHLKLLGDFLSRHFLPSPGVRQGCWCLSIPLQQAWYCRARLSCYWAGKAGAPSAWPQSFGVPRVPGDPGSCHLWVCVRRCLQERGPSWP